MAVAGGSLTWGQATATVAVGETVTVSVTSDVAPTNNLSFSPVAEIVSSTRQQVVLRGLSAGTKTIPANTSWSQTEGSVTYDTNTTNAFTLTVTAPVDDDSFLNKRGLTHFWENIDDIKQDKLTAGTGIAISNNVISATGGGEADSVAWGHITGTLANQTDLNTALGAKANTADLATVATSGSYNDLTNKPTIPSLTRRTSTSAPATVGSLVLGGNGTSTLPYAFPTIVGTNDESFWSYIRTTDITSGISEAYLGAYEYDPTENWWSGKKEARLALYSDIPTVPTKTSDLTNDSGFLTSVAWGDVTGKPTFATVAISGDYDDLTDKPTIGDATLTIQKNGTSAGTFTANATSNKTINITVPTDADDVGALPDTTKYGASISVSVNTTDYKVTTTLKDQDGNTLGTAQVIDLPLESVVVNGSYDSTNKKIVLTLQNGNTIDIPVADLIAGLQSEITSTNMLDADLVDDSTSTNKFVTAAQITKLNGIAAGAEVNVQSDWSQTNSSADDYIKNKPSLAAVATSGAYSDLSGTPSLAAVATSGSYNDLSNKPTIPAAQVNSDWNSTSGVSEILNKPTLSTVATTGSYNDLTDKPTIPVPQSELFIVTVSNVDTTQGTFTADKTYEQILTALNSGKIPILEVAIPSAYGSGTVVATLYNAYADGEYDSIFFIASLPRASSTSGGSPLFIANSVISFEFVKDLTGSTPVYTNYYENSSVSIDIVQAISSSSTDSQVPTAKSVYTALSAKADSSDIPTVNNATLTIQKNGATVQTFTANAASNKTANITVPTKTSDLTNDSGFLDSVAWGDVTGKPTFATVATSGSYNDLTNKPTIPAAVTVDSALSDSSTNPVQNQVITDALDLKANAADVSTALAGKQATLTAGDHISLSGSTISAVDYVHSDDPVSTQAVTPVVTNNMIADGTITAAKLATGATLQLTMSTSDIGEGAALAANTLYGVYE